MNLVGMQVVRSSAIGIGSTFARLSATLTPLVFLLVYFKLDILSISGLIHMRAGY